MYVRFNRAWLPYILGSLKQLMLQTTWQTDDPATLNLQQELAGQILYEFSLASFDKFCDPCEGDFDVTSLCENLRIHDGKIQAMCCGEWTDIPGQEGINIGGPTQPGSGSPQPTPGGGCQDYHAVFAANSQWLIPTLVNSGDVLTFSNASGAGHDGSISPWNCPDGSTFLAGACVGVGGTSGGDPAPTINHMRLIVNINGTWYPADSGSITVPGGVSGAAAYVQVNDSVLSDNSGNYALDINVCNNTATRYSHLFNFALGPQGWAVPGTLGAGWSAGKFNGLNSAFVNENRIYLCLPGGAAVDKITAHVNIEHVEAGSIYFESYATCPPSGAASTLYTQGLPGNSTADQNAIVPAPVTLPGGALAIQLDCPGTLATAYNEILSVTLEGPGTDPF
jgi:hypothetical protein